MKSFLRSNWFNPWLKTPWSFSTCLKKEEPLSLPKPLASLGLNPEGVHRKFSYPEELFTILLIAEQYFEKIPNPPVNPFALILAIRESERGRKGLEFGILHPEAKDTDLWTQAEWACGTVKKNIERFQSQSQEKDFIAFLGRRYAPVRAENDKEGLNQNWVSNVKFWYEKFSDG